jgi:small acid-soluble spore protein A (major alpha-type SASP)
MAKGQKRNVLLNPAAHKALDDMKYEIAAELGLPVYQGSEDYWGEIRTRDAGAVGGTITRRLVAMAQQTLANGQQKG